MLKNLLISSGHSVLLVLLHLVYFNLNWSLPLEHELMVMMSKVESFTGGHGRFDEKDYLFINTANDLALTKSETEYGEPGNTVITDRLTLAKFFDKIAAFGNRHKYILCDLFFDISSGNDSIFATSLKKVNKIIVPAAYDRDKKLLTRPLFDVRYAQADYITYEGSVSKIRLYAPESRSKTLPLVMYEDCRNRVTKIRKTGLYYRGNYIAESIYPRYFFDRERIHKHEMSLGTLVNIMSTDDSLFYKDVLEGKILVIGNFSNDVHQTFVGPMPGSLVLFNTYLTLEAGYHLINWTWFVFALISFGTLCYLELVVKKRRSKKEKKSLRADLKSLLGASGWCILISFLSGIIFKVHITIIPLIIYLELFRHWGKLKGMLNKIRT